MIRRGELGDFQRITEIRKSIFHKDWKEKDYEDVLADDKAIVLVNVIDGDVAGFGIMYVAADEAELPAIGTHFTYRQRGVGYELLQSLMDEAHNRGANRFFLEVRKSNVAARKLYEKAGFVNVGMRKNFYHHPDEDACVMTRTLL